jgi:hypothetical protein
MKRTRRRVLTAAAAVATAAPALLAGAAPPAAAAPADGTLTVTTVNRSGAEVVVHGITVIDSATGALAQVDSGVATQLPPGRYRVGTEIQEPDITDTVAGTIVTVRSGVATPVVFDARQGRELKVGLDEPLDPGSPYKQQLLARICDGAVPFAGTTNTPGKLFVIPDASAGATLGYASVWTAPGDVIEVVGGEALSAPPVATVDLVTLGTVNMEVRQGPGDAGGVAPTVTPSTPGCMQWASGDAHSTDGPYRVAYHLSMGDWNWTYTGGIAAWFADRTVREAETSTLVLNGAVSGPVRYLPWANRGTVGFFTAGLFADPVLTGRDLSVKADVALYRGTTLVASRKGLGNSTESAVRTFYGPVRSSAWYTLKAHAVRSTPGVPLRPDRLSTAADVAFRFHAGPGSTAVAPGYLTRFVPAGLDLDNSAPPGTDTPIRLTLDRTSTQAGVPMWPSTVRKVEVFASPDGGGSWRPLTVTRTAAGWSALLPATASPASVSLSARVTDTGGNTAVTTVYRAFTVR